MMTAYADPTDNALAADEQARVNHETDVCGYSEDPCAWCEGRAA